MNTLQKFHVICFLSDGRRGGGDRGNNQGFNRPNYDESRRQGQDRSTESPFGNYSNGPTQQTSQYGERQAVKNNSYSPNSQPGNHGNHNFMSLLGRGENRSMNGSKPPGGLQNYGENRQQSNSYPPLAPLKTSPNYPNTVSQENGYTEMPSRQGYGQATPAQQYQQEMPSNNYQQQQPAQGYHYQGESLSNEYQQTVPPAPQTHHYQEQQPSDGFQQQGPYFHEQKSSDPYQQQSGPEQGHHFQQQQPNSYEQPPAPPQGYNFQEQFPNKNFPAHQEPNQGYQQNNQQYNSWGDSPDGHTNNAPFGGPGQNHSSWQPREEPRSSGRGMVLLRRNSCDMEIIQ